MVRFVNSAGQSDYSAPIKTTTLQSPPSQPTNIRILERNISTILISWEKPLNPNGIITAYQIIYWEKADLKYQLPFINSNNSQFRIIDLKANSQYTISIKAKTEGGWGGESIVRASTEPKTSKPNSPDKINMVNRNETCIEVEWTISKEIIVNNYRVRISFPCPKRCV